MIALIKASQLASLSSPLRPVVFRALSFKIQDPGFKKAKPTWNLKLETWNNSNLKTPET
jgi:hypothetical protein